MSSSFQPSVRRTGFGVRRLSLGAVLAVFALAAACSDDAPTGEPCTDIPAGGCPLSRGVACEDPSCQAVYACRAGDVWELDHACPGWVSPDAASPLDASTDSGDGSDLPDAADASIDAPPGAYGGPGCGALQSPDCSLGFALACPSGCCDCEDLFVCENGGWNAWGSCTLEAGIQPF